MYPILVLALAIWFTTIMDSLTIQNRELASRYRSWSKQQQLVGIAENIEQFYQEHGDFPASLTTLAAATGFEQVRGLADAWQTYAISPTLSDGVWQFSRAALFSQDPSRGTTSAQYLATNACGTGSFDTATSWCGSRDSRWYRRETRERYNDEIMTQRVRMMRTLQKFADYYNSNTSFPATDHLNAALGVGSITALATLAGYAGTATGCTGAYVYHGVPIDCADMYDLWGNAVGYQFESAKRVILVSETPIVNHSGNRVVVASEYDFGLM